MNTLDLQAMGLEEMNEMEVREVEGGFNSEAYAAGASCGKFAGKVMAGVALLAFMLC